MEENKILKDQIENAPPEIKALLKKGGWSLVTKDIATKNNLTNEQGLSFENEILFVLLGMELLKDLAKNLKENVGLDENLASSIGTEVKEKIFKDIEQFLPTQAVDEIVPEIPPANLPMVEEGEVAHKVPHVEQPKMDGIKPITPPAPPIPPSAPAPAPVKHYEVDPYHEPLV